MRAPTDGYVTMSCRAAVMGLVVLCVGLAAVGEVAAQSGEDSHDVDVSVQGVSYLSATPGQVSIDGQQYEFTNGYQTILLTDESAQLTWRTNSSSQKITAALDRELPRFSLRAEARGHTSGQPAGEVTLSTGPVDFMLDVGRSGGHSDIIYTAVADMTEGHGTEQVTVIYTLTDQ